MTAPITIEPQDLIERLKSAAPPRILDVRTPSEFDTAHIAGAYNVPLDLLREHRDEILRHLDEDVVLVCRSGQRAAQAEQTATLLVSSTPAVELPANLPLSMTNPRADGVYQ